MNDELVEVLARAIYDNFYGAPDDTIVNTKGDVVTFSWDNAAPSAKEAMYRMARACLSAIESAGMVIVPREPTEEMMVAGADAAPDYTAPHHSEMPGVWSAMLAAAPK